MPVVELLVVPVRCSQAEAYARDWLSQNGNAIVMIENDSEHGGIDIKCGDVDQYAVGCLRLGLRQLFFNSAVSLFAPAHLALALAFRGSD